MAFYHFPSSNFHDLNLDWMIEKFEEWGAQWEQVKKAYEEFAYDMSDVYAQLKQLQITTDQQALDIQNLNGLVAQTDTALNNLILNLDATFTTLGNILSDFEGRINEIETDATFYMYSPFTGEYVPITTVITELASFHLQDALTAAEYDALDLTATYYDSKLLTAIQYDASGKTLLP